MPEVSIYIATTQADYRLAKALVASIERLAPGTPVIMLPDDDFPDATMFGHPVWRPVDPRVRALDGFYKKLRVFWGPAERFLFFDADQLVVRPLAPLFRILGGFPTPFFAPNLSSRVHGEWQSGTPGDRLRIFRERAGDPDRISQFDPLYDWGARFPFNSGEFAASRDAIDHEQLLEAFERAQDFHHAGSPDDPLIRSRSALFMGDQGFLNYYMARFRPGVELNWLMDVHWWGGHPEARRRPASDTPAIEGAIIHWAGCPRPGPIPMEPLIPGHLRWQAFYLAHCLRHGDVRGLIADSASHVHHVGRRWASSIVRSIRR